MKIKIKDLEEINYLTLKDIVEEAIQTAGVSRAEWDAYAQAKGKSA